MLRQIFLYLSNQERLYNFARNNRLAKSFASRFVAGETLDEALTVVAGQRPPAVAVGDADGAGLQLGVTLV